MIGVALVSLALVAGCSSAPAPTPTLSPSDATTLLRNHLFGRIQLIENNEVRSEFSSVLDQWRFAASYRNGEWAIIGPGIDLWGGENIWTDGRWTLPEASLNVSPTDSQASELLALLGKWINSHTTTPVD